MAKVKLATKKVEGNVVTFAFANGKTLIVDIGTMSSDIVSRLASHGAAQKVGDAYAGDGNPDDAYASAKAVLDNLTAGKWGIERTGNGPSIGLTVRALARFKGYDLATAQAKWDALTDEQKKLVPQLPGIKQAIAEIRLEEAKASTTTESAASVESLL